LTVYRDSEAEVLLMLPEIAERTTVIHTLTYVLVGAVALILPALGGIAARAGFWKRPRA
jgi:hypothetical protein